MMPEAEAWMTPCSTAFCHTSLCAQLLGRQHLHVASLVKATANTWNEAKTPVDHKPWCTGPTDQIIYMMIRDVQ
jgi:hypothetical protein